MTKTSSPLSIVICAFNGLEYTKLLLASIRKHSRLEHEVVLYSDGSTDGTLDWLRYQSEFRWQHDRSNRGICTAMNRAARMATRPYLFFPNTDHVVAPGWDEALARRLGPGRVVSCQCIEPGIVPVAPIFHARNCGGRWDEFEEGKFVAAAAELGRDRAVPGINYPFAMSRELWDEVGGLDERFNPGPANDPDLFYRLSFAGAEMVRADDCLVYHFSGKSSRLAGEAKAEHRSWHEVTERNEARFAEKWGERYRYSNGGLPDPGSEARKRWDVTKRGVIPRLEVKARLKVAIDADSVDEKAQGIGVYTANVIRSLAVLQDEIELLLIARRPSFLRMLLGELENISIHAPEKRLKDLGASVYHGPAFAVPEGLGVPAVVTIHDVIFALFPKWYPKPFVKHMMETARRSLAVSAQVIAVSDQTKADLLKEFQTDPARVSIIHEAPPADVATTVAAEQIDLVRGKYAGGSRFILAVGMQQRRKNAVGLVRAFARLKAGDAAEAPKLLLVGAAESEDPHLEVEIKKRRLAKRVFRTGHIPRSELLALYRAADLFVYPSFYEGFGLPPLEAMASGVPVVASNRSSMPEVLGDAAILVPPDDAEAMAKAMRRVLEDPLLRAQLIERGKKQAARFSWKATARQTIDVYRKAATKAPIEVRPASPSKRTTVSRRRPTRPRIAVDARLLGQDRLGTGRYTSEILRGIVSHAGDAELIFIGPEAVDPAKFPSTDPIMQLVPAGSETLLNPAWEQFSLPSHLLGCDLYFAPTGIAPVTAPCPTVPVIHDLGFEDHPGFYEERLRNHLTRWVRNSCLSAERIIAVSGFTRDRIVSHYGVAADRIDVIHHGAPSEAGTRSPNGEGAYVLCVSSFEPNKNLGTLIGAFRNAALSWEGRLVLAGRSGSELQVLRDRVDKHNLHNRVKLIVDPDDRELSRLYKGATIFVFPSLYEGFGLPILEAMAWGLPVLTGTAAACREVAGEAGIAVPTDTAEAWASSLSKVLSDPRTLEELGAKSLARAGAFSWQKAAKSTWDTLVSSLGER